MLIVEFIVWLAMVYVLVGCVVGALFAWRGVDGVDPSAEKGTWGFRLIVWPGCAALWPVVLGWWINAARRGRQGGVGAEGGHR